MSWYADLETILRGGLSVGFGGLVGSFFLVKGDEFISTDARQYLSSRLKSFNIDPPDASFAAVFAGVFDRVFGPDPARPGFILKTLLVSAVAIIFFFMTFLLVQPGLAESLFTTNMDAETRTYQRRAVFGQLFSTALLVNFAVDYLCIAYCRDVVHQMERNWSWKRVPWFLAKDLVGKTLLFIAAMGFYYGMSAVSREAFSGKISTALLSVPITLWNGLLMRNLSAVYIYSSLISSFWLWGYMMSGLIFQMAHITPQIWSFVKWVLPIDEKPVRSIGVIIAIFSTLSYWIWASLLN
jgi:hypothetical protein